MSDLHLRQRSVPELVDAAFTLFRRHPVQYLTVAAAAMSPAIALGMLVPVPMTTGQLGGSAALAQLIGVLGHALVQAVVTRAGSKAYLGGEPDVSHVLKEVLPRLPAVLVATILRNIAYGIGALLLLVGGAYAAARWFAVVSVVVLEGEGPLKAFKRSTQLSQGNKIHVLKTLTLVWIIYFMVIFGIGVATEILPDILGHIITSVVSIVAYPVVALAGMVLYYDTRIRNEGFDVEYLTGAIDIPAESAH